MSLFVTFISAVFLVAQCTAVIYCTVCGLGLCRPLYTPSDQQPIKSKQSIDSGLSRILIGWVMSGYV